MVKDLQRSRAIQKKADATSDLIDIKIADKIMTVSKKLPKELQNDEMKALKKDAHLQKKDNKLLMN